MEHKLKLAVLCGGQSSEHEVSIQSAKNVIAALDKNKYDISTIFITKDGKWFLFETLAFMNSDNPTKELLSASCHRINLMLGQDKSFVTVDNSARKFNIDLIFPVLHGPHGEDGTVQGLFKLANIPFVGPDVLSSAICMDKQVMKELLRAANIPTAKWLTAFRHEKNQLIFSKIVEKLRLPFFIKPINAGSSIGVSKVTSEEKFRQALDLAFHYHHQVIMEEYIAGREIECSVLGNEAPEASLPGEILTQHEFYTYEAKYLDPDGAQLIIPAEFPADVTEKIRHMAVKAFKALNCEGMARLDFFVTANNDIYVNEANTIPGFTQISMYPKMWMATGLSYSHLLDKLIELAQARSRRDAESIGVSPQHLENRAITDL